MPSLLEGAGVAGGLDAGICAGAAASVVQHRAAAWRSRVEVGYLGGRLCCEARIAAGEEW